MRFTSVEPAKMSNRELLAICTELQIAKNWGLEEGTIVLTDGSEVKVPVLRHKEYQDRFTTETGGY